MIELHPEILEKNGRPEFAVLPYEEFQAIREILADYEDLCDLRAAKLEEADASTMSLSEATKRYGTKKNRKPGMLRELNQAIERNAGKPLMPWAKAKKALGLS